MTPNDNVKRTAQRAADEARQQLTAVRLDRKWDDAHGRVLDLLHEQQRELRHLRRDVKRQRSGGFPWGLVLLAGTGYALYRQSPAVREQVQGLLNRLSPGVQGNLTRAGDAAADAASDLGQGRTPAAAVGRAAGEAQRAAGKTADKAADGARASWDDVKTQVRQTADDVAAGPRQGNS